MEFYENNDRIVSRIKEEYERGETTYMDAIEEIQRRCGYTPIEAETIVSDWEEEQG